MNLGLFDQQNLFAWCVASHDPETVTASERIGMLGRLGFRSYAWGNRMAGSEHLPRFDQELNELSKHGIGLLGRFIMASDDENDLAKILDHLSTASPKTQLWVTGGGAATRSADEQEQRLEEEIRRLRPLLTAARQRGQRVSLYNHAEWFGDPWNRLALIARLADAGFDNVGTVQTLHWAGPYLDRIEEVFADLKPHLDAVVLSGNKPGGSDPTKEILPVGAGAEDVRILGSLARSGWHGPVGLLNHTASAAELRLRDNLDGLAWVAGRLRGEDVPPPVFRTWDS